MITKKEMKQFVMFPFSIYKNNPYWVPPIIAEELETLNKDKNPAFENAEARFFVAIKNNKIVGRIATIINWYEVKKQEIKKMRFGWYDVIDDLEVSKALIQKVEEIGKKNDLEYMEGPVGFSNLDKVGVLIEGFNHIGTMVTWYSLPYYKVHLENLNFTKEKAITRRLFQVCVMAYTVFLAPFHWPCGILAYFTLNSAIFASASVRSCMVATINSASSILPRRSRSPIRINRM